MDLAVEKRNPSLVKLLRKNFPNVVTISQSSPMIFTEDSSGASSHSGKLANNTLKFDRILEIFRAIFFENQCYKENKLRYTFEAFTFESF